LTVFKFDRLGNGKLFLILLGVMLLAAILIALVLWYPNVAGTSKGPWFWRQG